jgi:hypothetical protein
MELFSATKMNEKFSFSGTWMKLENIIFFFLFICAYKAWVISAPCPHPLAYHPLRPLPLPPTPSIPSRNYFALISNFVVERRYPGAEIQKLHVFSHMQNLDLLQIQ